VSSTKEVQARTTAASAQARPQDAYLHLHERLSRQFCERFSVKVVWWARMVSRWTSLVNGALRWRDTFSCNVQCE
jgi:hypothetical protein